MSAAPQQEYVRTVFADRNGAQRQAAELQRKGLTFTEIAKEMGCRREAVVHMLYWQQVRS